MSGVGQLLPGEIEIAVVGAHLSGMPLNAQLTEIGGRLLRAATTEPFYRLYLLPGAAPLRPGLVRVGAEDGAAIATEVWALRADAFGRFVAAVPGPLCVGTLLLEDGTRPKGFLCEQAGLTGATDITAHGGWRAFMASRAESAA
jgi:allophanate hydrolase